MHQGHHDDLVCILLQVQIVPMEQDILERFLHRCCIAIDGGTDELPEVSCIHGEYGGCQILHGHPHLVIGDGCLVSPVSDGYGPQIS